MPHLTVILFVWLPCFFALNEIPEDCYPVQVTSRKGEFGTPFIKPALFCQQWVIQGQTGEIITVSFSYINLKGLDGVCGVNTLTIGSRRQENLCGISTPHVFISEENHVWIIYYQNTSLSNVGFKAKYIISTVHSKSCLYDEFTCNNSKCIDSSWRCNREDECGDGSDEDTCQHFSECMSNQFHCDNGKCINLDWKCDADFDCDDHSDEKNCYLSTPKILTITEPPDRRCKRFCTSRYTGQYICLEHQNICDGILDCVRGEDEEFCETDLAHDSCKVHVNIQNYGYIISPGYPNEYPDNKECVWVLHSDNNSKIQLRFKDFHIQTGDNTDYVAVYDGPDKASNLIRRFGELDQRVIESSSNYLTVVFHSDSSIGSKGFNFTYQNKGSCLPDQSSCMSEIDCFDNVNRCNGIWDCAISGEDEKNCGQCTNGLYYCGPNNAQCYEVKQRCNGVGHCTNMMDELSCTSIQCGPHNGTFLCDNLRCIYETWRCDKTNDCGDNSDEQKCGHITNLITIAAVAGAMLCALLLVIALGCTCKVYNLRVHGHRHPHETPLSRLYSEFIRRRAPPPYHEAMLTSRSYDDVRRDYLEHLQQTDGRPPSRRGRRSRSNPQFTQENIESTNTSNNENTENCENITPVETQNTLNIELERQNSTSLLILPDSCSDESESDTENQNETVQVSISEENVVTACYRRGSHINKSDSDIENGSAAHHDICSMDATIASCDSIEDDNIDCNDKTIDIVVETIPRRRQNSEGSLNSAESRDF